MLVPNFVWVKFQVFDTLISFYIGNICVALLFLVYKIRECLKNNNKRSNLLIHHIL